MKKEFLDECKSRVYASLRDLIGNEYDDKYHCIDDLRSMIGDDIIYFWEAAEFLENYRDELADYWDEEGYILSENNINPFSSSGLLTITREAISTACFRIADDIFPEIDGSFVLSEDMMPLFGSKLDCYTSYVFSLKEWGGEYPYVQEEFSYEQDAKERLCSHSSNLRIDTKRKQVKKM